MVPGGTLRHEGAFNSSSSLEILTSSNFLPLSYPSFWNSEIFYFSYLFAPTCHQFVTISVPLSGTFALLHHPNLTADFLKFQLQCF